MTYLWTIQKEEGKVEEKMSYFIRNQRAVRFKHLETGLCLGLTEDGMLFLKEDDGFGGDFIKISSLQQVKYE